MFLKRFKSDIDTSCAFCGDPNEIDMHIFWDCPHTLNSLILSIAMCSRVSLCFSMMYCLASLTYKKTKLMNILLLTYYYFLQNFIFTAVNSLIKILYLLFLKKRFNSISKLFHLPRILKLLKQLIYLIFLTYFVKALFWIIYLLLYTSRNGALHVMSPLCA